MSDTAEIAVWHPLINGGRLLRLDGDTVAGYKDITYVLAFINKYAAMEAPTQPTFLTATVGEENDDD